MFFNSYACRNIGPDELNALMRSGKDFMLLDVRTPQENAAGYDESASLAYADSLKGSFLLVHGTGDDNVHFQNSVRLVERLEAANKQFDMRIYPNRTHAIAGGNTRENLYGLFTAWLKAHL